VQPDVFFFGFDLTVEQVKGGSGDNPTDDPGWFFVIKERPGEPRLGLDIDATAQKKIWNDLAWSDLLPNAAPGSFIPVDQNTPVITMPDDLPAADIRAAQQDEDHLIEWGPTMSASDVAYVLYQVPVLVAVHGAEMLKDDALQPANA